MLPDPGAAPDRHQPSLYVNTTGELSVHELQ